MISNAPVFFLRFAIESPLDFASSSLLHKVARYTTAAFGTSPPLSKRRSLDSIFYFNFQFSIFNFQFSIFNFTKFLF